MKGIIYSIDGLLIGTIVSFFIFALQGLSTAATVVGILSILGLLLKSVIVSATIKERANAIWTPSRSRRIKNRKLRAA